MIDLDYIKDMLRSNIGDSISLTGTSNFPIDWLSDFELVGDALHLTFSNRNQTKHYKILLKINDDNELEAYKMIVMPLTDSTLRFKSVLNCISRDMKLGQILD